MLLQKATWQVVPITVLIRVQADAGYFPWKRFKLDRRTDTNG
ncbi:hypothetical protein ACFQ0Q_44825 [Streptomyces aureus]|jgi:hypothetical protein